MTSHTRQSFTHPRRLLVLLAAALFAILPLAAAQAAEPEVLAEGSWSKKSFAIKGQWSLQRDGDKLYVVLDDSFSTRKAPDLKIFLSPQSLDKANGKNATDGAVLVAPLESHKGSQRLQLPAGTDPASFQTILLHCEKYSKLWGGAPLGL